MTIKSINILIPLKNEQFGIKNLINNLKPILEQKDKEVKLSLIDDHSTDSTWDILKEFQNNFSFIKIYKNAYETGFGNALKFGIEQNNSDAVIIFMGDCSDEPQDINEYIKYLDEGYDCVFGSRFMTGSKLNNYPFVKLIFNRLANNLIRFISSVINTSGCI